MQLTKKFRWVTVARVIAVNSKWVASVCEAVQVTGCLANATCMYLCRTRCFMLHMLHLLPSVLYLALTSVHSSLPLTTHVAAHSDFHLVYTPTATSYWSCFMHKCDTDQASGPLHVFTCNSTGGHMASALFSVTYQSDDSNGWLWQHSLTPPNGSVLTLAVSSHNMHFVLS